MAEADKDSAASLERTIVRYNEAWNLYVRDGLVAQEWTATATHANAKRRGDLVAEPTGERLTWDGIDVIPFQDGLVKRKDVYSDSVSILRQVGLLA
jgi:hypothetical protein